jgi:hypothetical protein
VQRAELLEGTGKRIEVWNTLGRELCAGFVETAERVTATSV